MYKPSRSAASCYTVSGWKYYRWRTKLQKFIQNLTLHFWITLIYETWARRQPEPTTALMRFRLSNLSFTFGKNSNVTYCAVSSANSWVILSWLGTLCTSTSRRNVKYLKMWRVVCNQTSLHQVQHHGSCDRPSPTPSWVFVDIPYCTWFTRNAPATWPEFFSTFFLEFEALNFWSTEYWTLTLRILFLRTDLP